MATSVIYIKAVKNISPIYPITILHNSIQSLQVLGQVSGYPVTEWSCLVPDKEWWRLWELKIADQDCIYSNIFKAFLVHIKQPHRLNIIHGPLACNLWTEKIWLHLFFFVPIFTTKFLPGQIVSWVCPLYALNFTGFMH